MLLFSTLHQGQSSTPGSQVPMKQTAMPLSEMSTSGLFILKDTFHFDQQSITANSQQKLQVTNITRTFFPFKEWPGRLLFTVEAIRSILKVVLIWREN